jgi:hypothetical protein
MKSTKGHVVAMWGGELLVIHNELSYITIILICVSITPCPPKKSGGFKKL